MLSESKVHKSEHVEEKMKGKRRLHSVKNKLKCPQITGIRSPLYLIDASTEDVNGAVRKIVPDGADAVFEGTGIPACIDLAIPLCCSFGSFVWQGNYGADPVSFHFLPAHGRRLQMFFPCDDGLQLCRRAVLKNISMGTFAWEKTITHRIDYPDAPEMYSRINQGDKSILGMVICW